MTGSMLLLACLFAPLESPAALPDAHEALGLRVAPGFRVTLFADHEIANDIYAMTLDAKGRVVVTSAGWIKTLHDDDRDGRADRASLFARTKSGGMGLCFDGNELLFTGDGWLSRFRDADGDGAADGPAERIIPLAFGEHGGHAPRKGPDGWWYVIAGNDAGVDLRHATLPTSPVKQPETGALLRLPPGLGGSEIVACGFRNPYDFDFNELGDIFTYDSDCERDFLLPWYTPTRIYQVATGLHHGWRLRGYLRSYARRGYSIDTVDVLWPAGRGSPTGVAVYRHTAFPPRYRGGLFALDWTFGKVWFLPLAPEGERYATSGEVFIEPIGTAGFAPTDIAVAADGALFISIGGRKTRGAVYRVEALPAAGAAGGEPKPPDGDLERVLDAPQPLDAWSRALWEPIAKRIGPAGFAAAAAEESRGVAPRLRAIEVSTELFGGLPPGAARELAASRAHLVRARVAWSLGRAPAAGALDLLVKLADDSEPRVALAALEALAGRTDLDGDALLGALVREFGRPEQRVRQAAARLASLLAPDVFERLRAAAAGAPAQTRLSLALSEILRDPQRAGHARALEDVVAALPTCGDAPARLQAVRLAIRALGDSNLERPPSEVESDYSLPETPLLTAELRARLAGLVRPLFPSKDERLDSETSRLLAMLEDADPALPEQVAALLTAQSPPARDFHLLIVLVRLRGEWRPETAARAASALLLLDKKIEGGGDRVKQTWGSRIAELAMLLARRDPRFASELLESSDLVRPGNIAVAAGLAPDLKLAAARRFFLAATGGAGSGPAIPWSASLVDLLGALPIEETRPALRGRSSRLDLRDAIARELAKSPEPADRELFLSAIESPRPDVIRSSLGALEALPRAESPECLAALAGLIKRLCLDPKEPQLRARAAALIAREAGRAFAVAESGTDAAALRRAYAPIFDWLRVAHPEAALPLEGDASADLRTILAAADWEKGDAGKGAQVFRARGCETCHAAAGALGPSLEGAAARLSREDLFQAIASPSKDVAPAYLATVFELAGGRSVQGIVVFESADGWMVQTGAATTERIASAEVRAIHTSSLSFMPVGLLDGLAPRDLADLYRFISTLGR